mgnify:CR=1 FL=1
MPRAATPTAIKIKTGNPGKRRINKAEPKPRGGPQKPAVMTAGAKKLWDRLIAAMPVEVYTGADSALLAAYCEAVNNHQHATAAIAEPDFQMFVVGSTGQDILNPIFAHQEKQARLIISIGQRLGLDPIARQQINSEGGDDSADPFSNFVQ